MSGDKVTTPASILGKEGYIAFIVESNLFRAAAKDNEMDRPTVTLDMAALTPASPDTRPTSPDTRPTSPDTTNPIGVGSSSGGCSAGSAVLALAVLGSFVLVRRK